MDFVSRVAFLMGFVFGISLVLHFTVYKKENISKRPPISKIKSFETNYSTWFKNEKVVHSKINFDEYRYSLKKYHLESEFLFEKVKVLCVILIRRKKNKIAANSTWTQNCNNVMFVNLKSLENEKKPIIRKKVQSSWTILCKTLLDIPLNMTYNWLLIVNDDTFAIVENLRYLVASLDPKMHYYLGHGISFWGTNYNSGEAGYALSEGTVLKLQNSFNSTEFCFQGNTFMNQEDFYLGKVLNHFDINPSDTRDAMGFSTFNGFNLQKLFFPGSTVLSNYYKLSLYPVKCCSHHTITFKSTDGDKMYTYYYLIYHLQLFEEGNLGNRPASTPIPEKEVWQSFLRNQSIFVEDISAKEYYKVWEKVVNDPKIFAQHLQKEQQLESLYKK